MADLCFMWESRVGFGWVKACMLGGVRLEVGPGLEDVAFLEVMVGWLDGYVGDLGCPFGRFTGCCWRDLLKRSCCDSFRGADDM